MTFPIICEANTGFKSVTLFDYDVFMIDTVFYVLVGLLAGIVVDISYGFIDPRIRMGER